jgi:hypothetical protein
MGYLRVLGIPDSRFNLKKFRNKRRGEIRRLYEWRVCWHLLEEEK